MATEVIVPFLPLTAMIPGKESEEGKIIHKCKAVLPCTHIPERLYFYTSLPEYQHATISIATTTAINKKPIKIVSGSNLNCNLQAYLQEACLVAVSFAANDTPLIRVLKETATEKEIVYSTPVFKDNVNVGALIAFDLIPENQCPSPRDFVQSPRRNASSGGILDRLLNRSSNSTVTRHMKEGQDIMVTV